MTSPEVMKIKALAAILEAIDSDDEDDAKAALKLIRGLVGETEKK
jgi:hypothetical protein